MSNQSYVFFGYEVLYGRVGLDLGLGNITKQDEVKRMIEIKQIYKDTWGYDDVVIKKDPNDPSMVLVYVRPNKPYSTNIYR